MNKLYWFSFSYKGKNQGCCIVEEEDGKKALQKTIDLNIHPKHDDIQAFEIGEPELELNRLYTPEELTKLGYVNQKNY